MENASKALIMAGGILIALMVLGALLLMFNQVSMYQRGQSDLEEVSQLTDFNEQFTRYVRNDLAGTDLISLANKVIDYNLKSGGIGEVDYSLKIELQVTLGTGFATKNGGNLEFFDANKTYVIQNSNSEFYKIIEECKNYEYQNTLNGMLQLSSYYETIASGKETVKDIIGNDFKNTNGAVITDINQILTIIRKYREYSNLKSSTFKIAQDPSYYESGQIKDLKFIFSK